MKKIQLLITFITIATAGLFISCDYPPNKMESIQISGVESDREMGITRSQVQEEIMEFRIEMADRIIENNRSVAHIKRKIKSSDMSVRVIQEAKIIVLQSENQELKRIMDNYNDLSRKNWDDFKKGFTSDMEDLDHSLDNFFEYSYVSK